MISGESGSDLSPSIAFALAHHNLVYSTDVAHIVSYQVACDGACVTLFQRIPELISPPFLVCSTNPM